MNNGSEKSCKVCGDKALGYNFNVVSCESCKAFFRRNGLKNQKLTCPFNNKCEISVVTRRFCQSCRLNKCFEVGMKKEFIMSEDDKRKKKLKIEQNRSKRKSKLLNEDDDVDERKDHSKANVKKLKLENHKTELNSNVEMSPSTSVNSEYSTTDSDFQFPLIEKINLTINNLKTISSTPEFFETINTLTKLPRGVIEIVQNLLSAPKETLNVLQQFMNITPNDNNTVTANDNETIRSVLSINNIKNNNNIDCPPERNISNADNHEDKSYSTILNEIMFDIKSEKLNFQPFMGNSIDSIISEAIKLEYNTSQIAAQLQSHNSYELNEIEMHKIQELLDANSTLLNEPIDENYLSLLPSFIGGIGDDSLESKSNQFLDPVLINVINLTAVCLRRLIKMSKKITAFKRMCQNDQIALLKGSCTEMMILRSCLQYDSDHAFWKIPSVESTSLKADILKLCPKGNVFEEHENFIKTFDIKLRTDERIIMIMCAITLFSPDRANIVHKDVITLEQNSYYFLLRRYLESVFDGCQARSIFLQLLKKIHEVKRLNEKIISVYLDVNASQVEPLLREIFDLKA